MNLRRLLGVFLLALTGLVVLTVPASAHATLESSSPAEGAQVAQAPTEIKLVFNEAVTLPPDPVKVEGRDGTRWKIGPASVAGTTVTVPLTPAGAAQAYTVTYNLIADDGDNMSGTVHFTLTAPVPAETATSAPSAPSGSEQASPASPSPTSVADVAANSGVPGWIWILVAVVVLLAAAIVAVRLAKGRRSE